MDKNIETESEFTYSILDEKDTKQISKMGRAFSSPQRIRILKALAKHPMNLLEISDLLKMPISSVSFNVDVLADAKLILIDYKPATKGHMKLCSLCKTSVHISMDNNEESQRAKRQISTSMPVGCYSEATFKEGYLVGENGFIYRESDCPYLVFTPERFSGQLFGFDSGHVSYDFPNLSREIPDRPLKLSFSLELCSEAPYYRNNWPSDITIWVNDIEIATYTSPGDFGGKRGLFTPLFWKTESTQYGILKNFSIDKKGCYIDGVQISSSPKIDDLHLSEAGAIRLKIGFKEDAVHVGGVNLFGKHFGNFDQDIVMTFAEDDSDDL